MHANYNTPDLAVQVFTFDVEKVNKFSRIYIAREQLISFDSFLTPVVKLEDDQGFSKAKGVKYHFRIRNEKNWNKCKVITGLFSTTNREVYFGDYKSKNGKTLMIFKISREKPTLQVYVYPEGYYPSRQKIEKIISNF